MKTNTPLMELISEIQGQKEYLLKTSPSFVVDTVISIAQSLLETEKQLIIDAHFAGVSETVSAVNEHMNIDNVMHEIRKVNSGLEKHEDGKHYFSQTFNQ